MFFIIIFSEDLRKTKVGSSFSDLLDILYGVPQVSILGLLPFNNVTCFCLSIALNFPTFQMILLLMNVVKSMMR